MRTDFNRRVGIMNRAESERSGDKDAADMADMPLTLQISCENQDLAMK